MAKKPTYEELEQRVEELEKKVDAHKQSKQAEEALREARDYLEKLFNYANAPIIVWNPESRIVRFNHAFEHLTGYKDEEVIGRKLSMLFPEASLDESLNKIQDTLSGEYWESVEIPILCKNGDIRVALWNSANIYAEDGTALLSTIAQGTDITLRKQAEEALRESEEKYRSMMESMDEAVYICSSDYRVEYMNPAMVKRTSWGAIGEPCYKAIHELDEKCPWCVHDKVQQGESLETEIVSVKDGRSYHISQSPIFHEDGSISEMTIFRDITERKKADEALRESQERLSSFMDSATDGFILFDSELNYIDINKSTLEITGLDRKEFIGKNVLDVVPNLKETGRYDKYKEVIKTGAPFLIPDLIPHAKFGIKHVEVKAFKVGDGLGIIFTDITDRVQAEEEKRRLEDQLHQAQKMEALGLMAGAVAHDLNNILSGIVAYPDLILMDLPEESPLREPIEVMKDSGNRAVDVVADLMTITRGVATGKTVVNLNYLAEEHLISGEHDKLQKMRPSVVFKTEFDTELLNITCSPTHIKKSLMNLVTNASEAIEGGGTVTISTTNRYLDEPLKGYEDVHIGEYTVLSVSDDGPGISPEDLERIFEPFYTKKVMGKSGTGLGLTIVWNTVQDHQGYIDVRTSERGTVFDLYFPVTRDELTQAEEEVPREDYQGHGERILVVDDEEKQRVIACWLLTRLGYVAEAVSSGEEAIEYVKEQPVDLIVLDMVMPKGINGRETYEEIIKIRPGQKAIIASGYAKTKEVDLAQELGAGKYIKKPYTLGKVGLAVKVELEK